VTDQKHSKIQELNHRRGLWNELIRREGPNRIAPRVLRELEIDAQCRFCNLGETSTSNTQLRDFWDSYRFLTWSPWAFPRNLALCCPWQRTASTLFRQCDARGQV